MLYVNKISFLLKKSKIINEFWAKVFGIIILLYLFSGQIMVLYFWWLWAQDHNFLNTVFIGFFVSEFKGFFWIFYI